MKKFIVCMVLLMAVIFGTTVVMAAKQKQVKTEKTQQPIPTEDTTDTATVAATNDPTYTDSVDSSQSNMDEDGANDDGSDVDDLGNLVKKIDGSNTFSMMMLIPIIGTISGCLLVLAIIFLVFYFRYKNRQAKYRLAEKALESGKPLPEGVFTPDASTSSATSKSSHPSSYNTSERDKGIRNTFLGIGLFIFLWAITGSFGVGCVGLLVMFMGIGRWYTAYEHRKDNDMLNNLTQPTDKPKDTPDDDAEKTTKQDSDNVNTNDTATE